MAEGVETQQQAKILGSLGCRGQGYYFSKPVSAEEIVKMLGRETGLRDRPAASARRRGAQGGKPLVLELIDGTKPG